MTRPTVGTRSAVRRPRAPRCVGLLVATLGAVVLSSCSSETVTPASSPVAYVTLGAGSANPGKVVSPVATTTGAVGRAITVGTLPSALALVPGGRDVVMAIKAQNELVEVSTSTGRVVHRVEVGLEPDAVAVTPDGRFALVANFGDDTVTPVHLDGFAAGPIVAVGRQPAAIAVTPDGSRALVADYLDGALTPIALPALTAGAPVAVGPEPSAVVVSTDGTTALVAGFQTSSVTPVSLPGLVPGAAVAISSNPLCKSAAQCSTSSRSRSSTGATPRLIPRLSKNPIPAARMIATRLRTIWINVDDDLADEKLAAAAVCS